MQQLRNVTLADDGTLMGERLFGQVERGPWTRFRAPLDLWWVAAACDADQATLEDLWALQDGYGEPGYTPPQGWDWSGIRDSSPQARGQMFALARQRLPVETVADLLGVPVAVLVAVAAEFGTP